MQQNRRDFLKTSAAGAAGMVAVGAAGSSVMAQSHEGWYNGLIINPQISNLRVVYSHDSAMLTNGTYGNFSQANGRVDAAKVRENLDKMAVALAQKADATQAWQTIFRKPDTKQWNEVTAAIKVNTIGDFHPLKAVVAAIAEGLKAAGVQASNITVFDATQGRCNTLYAGVSPDVKTSQGGGTFQTKVGNDMLQATSVVQNLDILITCAVCKKHDWGWGNVTMALKNHVGTVKFGCPNSYDKQLTDINKSVAIMGNPSDTVPARQQLAVIDCLWAADDGGGWWGGANKDPRTLVMGTFAGAVDFLTSHKIRTTAPVNATINVPKVRSFITDFGYSDNEADELLTIDPETTEDGRGWVDASTYQIPVNARRPHAAAPSSGVLVLSVGGNGLRTTTARIPLSASAAVERIDIFDMRGTLVNSLIPAHGNRQLHWNGSSRNGTIAATGTYVVCAVCGSVTHSASITLAR